MLAKKTQTQSTKYRSAKKESIPFGEPISKNTKSSPSSPHPASGPAKVGACPVGLRPLLWPADSVLAGGCGSTDEACIKSESFCPLTSDAKESQGNHCEVKALIRKHSISSLHLQLGSQDTGSQRNTQATHSSCMNLQPHATCGKLIHREVIRAPHFQGWWKVALARMPTLARADPPNSRSNKGWS